jgi:TRAP-type C4-dicarboxylate transport system permease small subunit
MVDGNSSDGIDMPIGGPSSLPDRIVLLAEKILFTVILLVFLFAGLAPIVCRIFDLPGIPWSGSLSNHLVLWVALFGAGAAARDRKQLCIDAVGHFLPWRGRMALRAAGYGVAAIVCLALLSPAIRFTSEEIKFGGDEIAFFGVPQSWLPGVLPIGFALLALRLGLAAWGDARAALNRDQVPARTEEGA